MVRSLNVNVVSRKQPSIRVYAAWNIKIDILNFPVSEGPDRIWQQHTAERGSEFKFVTIKDKL